MNPPSSPELREDSRTGRSTGETLGIAAFGAGCLALAVGLALGYVAVQDLSRSNPLQPFLTYWRYELAWSLAMGVGALLVAIGAVVRWGTERSVGGGSGPASAARTVAGIVALTGGAVIAGGSFLAAGMADIALAGGRTQFPDWSEDLSGLTAGIGLALLAVAVLLRWNWATPRSSSGPS